MTKAAPPPTALRPTTARQAEPTVEELMTAAGAGDQGAFAQLYERLAAPVLTTALRVLRNRAHAEEVTQEVMVELWRTAARYTADKGTAMAWALTITRRRAIDRVRTEQAAVDRAGKATFEAARATPFDDVAEQAENHEEYAQVQACLSGLPEVQRQAVTMAYYQGMTYLEVATSLGAPLGTVKTRMRDGLIRMRACLRAVS
ncbi:sigma-70 family RNA polymerase sigma factor [Actinokineospora pegani]|uniref:sigma-70 family RNA polymerase sigma factor n=1 Tax=Actinokineospora pegani TaxID=2654637 RepID=UPI0012E9D2D9|nr:sigma-70 family RNA polymerase sigma factor [Actinokineospora pegani]